MTGDQPPGAHASIDTTPAEARGWPLRRYHTAGGIVVRDGRALLLHRIKGHVGEVRLPKGHVEPGETEERRGRSSRPGGTASARHWND
ncbi:MAG TPA: NUDIX domain-containing protein [Dehalococcoidia bacterium]